MALIQRTFWPMSSLPFRHQCSMQMDIILLLCESPNMPDLLAVHGLTGCDTVAQCYGIGKGVALKVLRSQVHSLSHLGDDSKTL